MDSIRMPSWLRMVLVAGAVVLLTGASLFAYRWFTRPTTLTIAVGSLDGEAGRIVSAIASRFAATSAPVRLQITETSSAIDAAQAFRQVRSTLRWCAATSAISRRRRRLPSSRGRWRC